MAIAPHSSVARPWVLALLGAIFMAAGVLLFVLTEPVSPLQNMALNFFTGIFAGIGLVLMAKAFLNLKRAKRR
jgi:hypothetical protein